MAAAARLIMSSLPSEMQALIFLKLPVKSILSCKCVCKLWFNLISSPKFISDHLNLSIQNNNNHKLMFIDTESDTETGTCKPLIYCASVTSTPDLSCEYIGNEAVLMDTPFKYQKGMDIRVVGSCNGLICFGIVIDIKTSFYVWNPATREYKEIKHFHFDNNPVYCDAGFGYDSKTGDYKMVTIVDSKRSGYCEVEVYTFGSHFSRTIHTFPYKYPVKTGMSVVFLNGALHWMSEQDIYHGILAFDISNEKLMDVPLPRNRNCILERNKKLYKTMGVLGDCLSLVLVHVKKVEIWVMQDYGVRESWTKLFTTTQEPLFHYPYWMPMLSLKNGDILMYTFDGFVLCNPKNGRVGMMSSFFKENIRFVRVLTLVTAHPVSYVESLVSLNSGTYVKKPKGGK